MVVETEFYDTLEIIPTATEDEILKGYRTLARIYHPDRNPEGAERFQDIVEAYKVLSDPEQGSLKNWIFYDNRCNGYIPHYPNLG